MHWTSGACRLSLIVKVPRLFMHQRPWGNRDETPQVHAIGIVFVNLVHVCIDDVLASQRLGHEHLL
jgi:hypothetical protein